MRPTLKCFWGALHKYECTEKKPVRQLLLRLSQTKPDIIQLFEKKDTFETWVRCSLSSWSPAQSLPILTCWPNFSPNTDKLLFSYTQTEFKVTFFESDRPKYYRLTKKGAPIQKQKIDIAPHSFFTQGRTPVPLACSQPKCGCQVTLINTLHIYVSTEPRIRNGSQKLSSNL